MQEKVDEAIVEFEKAIAIDPEYAEAHYHLGIAYAKQSNSTLAEEYLYEAGVLALLQGDKVAALKSYRGLQHTGSQELLEDLGEMIAPWLEPDSEKVEPQAVPELVEAQERHASTPRSTSVSIDVTISSTRPSVQGPSSLICVCRMRIFSAT